MKNLFALSSSNHGQGRVAIAWNQDGNFLATCGVNRVVHILILGPRRYQVSDFDLGAVAATRWIGTRSGWPYARRARDRDDRKQVDLLKCGDVEVCEERQKGGQGPCQAPGKEYPFQARRSAAEHVVVERSNAELRATKQVLDSAQMPRSLLPRFFKRVPVSVLRGQAQ